ncbi:MAG: ATP-binding protein [Acidimicrobiales bacterium]
MAELPLGDDSSGSVPLTVAFGVWAHRLANDLVRLDIAIDEVGGLEPASPEFRGRIAPLAEAFGYAYDQLRSAVFRLPPGAPAHEQRQASAWKVLRDCLSSSFAVELSTGKLESDLFHVAVEPGLPLVEADPDLLEEAVRNLVENAVAATGSRPHARIELQLFRSTYGVTLEVRDNGPGLPADVLATVQARKGDGEIVASLSPLPPHAQPAGRGLGLRLAASAARSWGGALEVQETNERGTSIGLHLRSRGAAPPQQLDAVTSQEMPPSASASTVPPDGVSIGPQSLLLGRARILVVDDDELVARHIASMLSNSGIDPTIDIAFALDEAMPLIESQTYDLAVMDVIMGPSEARAAGGLHLAHAVRNNSPDAIIVVLTGYLDRDFLTVAFQSGVDEYLLKPDIGQLVPAINRVTMKREALRESLRRRAVDTLMYDAITTISHELRSPMLTAKRETETLAAGALGTLGPRQEAAVTAVQRAIDRALDLVNAHLDLRRLDSGDSGLITEEWDLEDLIKGEVNAHDSEISRKRLSVRIHTRTSSPVVVQIDVSRLRVALNPLLENAVKYSPDDGSISVKLRADHDNVVVSITDEGPGIRGNELDTLLGLQRDPDGRQIGQRMRSSGLGLSLAKRLIELHGGSLWLEPPPPGSGTTVVFRLPLSSRLPHDDGLAPDSE